MSMDPNTHSTKDELSKRSPHARQLSLSTRVHTSAQVIMNFPPLDHAFEKHVQDYLCSESYDFLKEVRRVASVYVPVLYLVLQYNTFGTSYRQIR